MARSLTLYCPFCSRLTAHVVELDAAVPELVWCQECFRVRETIWNADAPGPGTRCRGGEGA